MGNGRKLRVGEDPWMGSSLQHLLPRCTVEALRQQGITFLSHLADPVRRRLGIQSWLQASSLGLEVFDERALAVYIRALKQAHLVLSDRDDKIAWDFDPSGIYSPRAGYQKLSEGNVLGEVRWWWKNLWKLNCPPKTRLFMWCVLENKVPTWDVLQNRCFQGPG